MARQFHVESRSFAILTTAPGKSAFEFGELLQQNRRLAFCPPSQEFHIDFVRSLSGNADCSVQCRIVIPMVEVRQAIANTIDAHENA